MTPLTLHCGRDWRSALTALDPAAARAPVSLHAARFLLAKGKTLEAEAALREFVDRHPNHRVALEDLAALLRRNGREAEAVTFLNRAVTAEIAGLVLDDAERSEAELFMLAAERAAPVPQTSSPAVVRNLFDGCAEEFETHLTEHLKYRAPELLFEAVARLADPAPASLDVLDIGCGTGLAGQVFRPLAKRLDGIDLSAQMLEKAAEKGIYDDLAAGELVADLATRSTRYDLVLAADVFVYLGDLSPVLAGSARVLRDGGLVAFTVEASESPGYALAATRRYLHHRDHLTETAAAAGLTVRVLDETWTRWNDLRPVPSYLCVLSKDA